jgi:hypothetical protein
LYKRERLAGDYRNFESADEFLLVVRMDAGSGVRIEPAQQKV